jgi:hypothetical protein
MMTGHDGAPRSVRDLSHLAFCALVALYSSRQTSTVAETLFLIRWLVTVQKQKRFSKALAADIQWLLDISRQPGVLIRQRLESLWASGSGSRVLHPELPRLIAAMKVLQENGWEHEVLKRAEWPSRRLSSPVSYVVRPQVTEAFSPDGVLLSPVAYQVVGDVQRFQNALADQGLHSRVVADERFAGQVFVDVFPAN